MKSILSEALLTAAREDKVVELDDKLFVICYKGKVYGTWTTYIGAEEYLSNLKNDEIDKDNSI